ncbi:MAG: hypothetical protein QOI53_2467 [Verrucomicrobiota bacterium]|nr:hypothetical protein [Verrucomicrobiota bacterium]
MNFATLPGLAVLNPGGRDPDQSFKDEPGQPDETAHPPVNYHGYAACTCGAFYRRTAFAARHRNVLLLLRGDLSESQRAFTILKAHGCFVAVAFKESGTQQVARQLSKPKRFQRFHKIASSADLCLSSTLDLLPLFASVSKPAIHVPTPYPLEYPFWNFSRPVKERHGLFIGTREFDVLSRNHLLALSAARNFSAPITVINPDGKSGLQQLKALMFPEDQLKVVAPLPYPGYLRLMASHRLVLQFDQSSVPGQVAGDSLLCRIPTVGGNGAVEQLAFPELSGSGRTFDQLVELTRRLLNDEGFYQEQLEGLERCGGEHLSFAKGREALSRYFPGLT